MAQLVVAKDVSWIKGTAYDLVTLNGSESKFVTRKGSIRRDEMCCIVKAGSFLPRDGRYEMSPVGLKAVQFGKGSLEEREGYLVVDGAVRFNRYDGVIYPLYLFIGKELQFSERQATPEDVVAADGKPVTAEELEGVGIAEVFYMRHHEACGDKEAYDEKVEVDEGTDMTELLHVESYGEVERSYSAEVKEADRRARTEYPEKYIPTMEVYDLRNLPQFFGDERMSERRWQVSQLYDGLPCMVAFSPTIDFADPNIVCNAERRLVREEVRKEDEVYWEVVRKHALMEKLSALSVGGDHFALQGYIVGPHIGKAENGEVENRFVCCRIWDFGHNEWLHPDKTVRLCNSIEVPHAKVYKESFAFFAEIKTLDEAVKFAEGKYDDWGEFKRMGVVCRSVDGRVYNEFQVRADNH